MYHVRACVKQSDIQNVLVVLSCLIPSGVGLHSFSNRDPVLNMAQHNVAKCALPSLPDVTMVLYEKAGVVFCVGLAFKRTNVDMATVLCIVLVVREILVGRFWWQACVCAPVCLDPIMYRYISL